MKSVKNLIDLLEQKRQAGNIGAHINGSHIQIYERSPLEFNVTLPGCHCPTIKFEKRSPGKFTVAVAPEDGASIDYTQAREFAMDDSIERLATAFPQSEDMRQFVNCLTNSR